MRDNHGTSILTLMFSSVLVSGVSGASCPGGYDLVDSVCVRYERNMKMTWDQARSQCVREGAHLAVPDTNKRKHDFYNYVKARGGETWATWVDGREIEGSREWFWYSKGTKVERDVWHSGQPDGRSEHCTAMEVKTGAGLHDYPCSLNSNFLCEYDKGANDCKNYQPVAGMCLKFNMHEKTWHDGKKACEKDNGDLAAFDTMEKFNAFRLYLEVHGPRESTFWVNGRQEEQYHWTWKSTNKTVNPYMWESGLTYTYKCLAYRQGIKHTTKYEWIQGNGYYPIAGHITSKTTSKWTYGMIDITCNTNKPYICEYKGVDASWGAWSDWSSCNASCGQGSRTRTRKCDKPPTQYGGKDCAGSSVQTGVCNEGDCPVDGGWSAWENWSSCSVSCGGGTRIRRRSCTNPKPEHGGKDCPQNTGSQSESCSTQACPIDGAWSDWEDWTQCTKTCGGGTMMRSRTCTNPRPQHGGKDCLQGNAAQTLQCNMNYCPIDGGWAAWKTWSSCSVSCGGGTRIRRRLCTNPKPEHGGRDCHVNAGTQSEICNVKDCPMDGAWSVWTHWSMCSKTCGQGSRTRHRACNSPPPSNGGKDCLGQNLQTENCKVGYCPVDGGWLAWETWSSCSVSCGGGTRIRRRSCTNPKPEHGGSDCPQNAGLQSEPCNANDCPKCCGKARFILNGHPDKEHNLCYGDTVSYICDRGFKSSNNTPIVCSSPYAWTNIKLPTCEADGKCNSSDIASPVGGYKACSGDDLDKVCYMHCPTGQEYTQKHSVFQCNANTGWAWKVPLGDGEKYISAAVGKCQVSDDPSGLELFLWGTSISLPSSKSDAVLKLEIEKKMLQELLAKKICTTPCKIKDIEIERLAFHAYRREVPQVKQFRVKITLYAAPAKGSITTEQSARIELSKTLKLLKTKAAELKQTILANKVTLQIDGAPVVLKGNNIQISKPSLACPDGSIRKAFNCYTCPEGTYHDIGERQCASCPFAQYQDQPGQTSCKLCPNGTTTDRLGVNNVTSCREYAGCNCGIHPCSFNGTKFECDCLPGYEKSNGTCTDTNECLTNVCPANAKCINREGSYQCECLPGFEGGSCLDIDECKFPSTCPYTGMLCNNTVGSFTCTCKRGLYGDHCDQKCPPMFSRKQNTCLFISKSALSYDNGSRLCSDISTGAHLVHIKDKGKYKAVTNTLQPQWSYWMGMNDKTKEGEFVFTDGSKLGSSYSEWGASSTVPKFNDPTKNCVIIDGPDAFMWKVADCNGKHLVICEVEIM